MDHPWSWTSPSSLRAQSMWTGRWMCRCAFWEQSFKKMFPWHGLMPTPLASVASALEAREEMPGKRGFTTSLLFSWFLNTLATYCMSVASGQGWSDREHDNRFSWRGLPKFSNQYWLRWTTTWCKSTCHCCGAWFVRIYVTMPANWQHTLLPNEGMQPSCATEASTLGNAWLQVQHLLAWMHDSNSLKQIL